MKRKEVDIRERLLRPIAVRSVRPAGNDRIEAALDDLRKQANAQAVLPLMVEIEKRRGKDSWKDPGHVKAQVKFVRTIYDARRLSLQQYVVMASSPVERLHEHYLFEGKYPELITLENNIRDVEKRYGLKDGEYWPTNKGPKKYNALQKKWDQIAHSKLCDLMRELEGGEASALLANNKSEFNRLRERGRRSVFHKADTTHALVDTIIRYESDARKAANAGSYTAAVVLMGSSLEGLLLLRCLRATAKAISAARQLPKGKRPAALDKPEKWTLDQLINVCLEAGWLPMISTENLEIRPVGLAQLLREMRNHIHPGKVCVERPWLEAEQRDFETAEIIYTTLYAATFRTISLRRLAILVEDPMRGQA